MRPKYITGIILGSFMIYLGIFGFSGLLYALTGTLFKDDFNTLSSGWTTGMGITPTIENGALKLAGTTIYECTTGARVVEIEGYQTFYAEAKIRMDSGDGRWYMVFNTLELTYLAFSAGTVYVASNAAGTLKSVGSYTTGVYATYTLKVDRVAQTYTVEKDSVTLGSGIIVHRTQGIGSINIFFCSDKEGSPPFNGVMYVDYIELGTGETTQPPPPNKASVTVLVNRWNGTGWEGAIGVSVTVKQNGATIATWTTSSGGSTGAQQLDAGTYNFATSGAADSVDDTISAGGTYTEQLWVGAANPNPQDPIITAIKAFFNNVYVKDGMIAGGILTVIISAIVTVIPSKRKSPAPSSRGPIYQ